MWSPSSQVKVRQLVCYDSQRLSQHSVTIVDMRCHKCLHEGFSQPNIQRLPDMTNLSEMKEADNTDS